MSALQGEDPAPGDSATPAQYYFVTRQPCEGFVGCYSLTHIREMLTTGDLSLTNFLTESNGQNFSEFAKTGSHARWRTIEQGLVEILGDVADRPILDAARNPVGTGNGRASTGNHTREFVVIGAFCLAAIFSIMLCAGFLISYTSLKKVSEEYRTAVNVYFSISPLRPELYQLRHQVNLEVNQLRRLNGLLSLAVSLDLALAALLVLGGTVAIACSRRSIGCTGPLVGVWWVATSPAVLLTVAAIGGLVEDWWYNNERRLYCELGTYVFVLSGALLLSAAIVAVTWEGRKAKLTALFATMTAVPLGLWGMKWILRNLEVIPNDSDFDRNLFARLAIGVVVPLSGAAFLFFGFSAWRQRRKTGLHRNAELPNPTMSMTTTDTSG